jgi:hypothetical protein
LPPRLVDGKWVDPIRVNGGDPNAPASAFTSMWTAKFNGAPQLATQSRKAAGYQEIMAMPGISEEVRQHALTRFNQQVQADQIAMEQDDKARKLAAEQAQSDLVTKIIAGSNPGIIAEIANSPALDGPQKENLYNFAVQKGGIADTLEFGPGYTQAFKAVTAPSDDPAKITDVASIIRRAGPGGDLTMKGASQLIGVMDKIRKQPDQAGISTTKAHQLEYYQNKFGLSQSDLGGFLKPFKNQKGLDRFNHDFVPAFESAYSDWVAKGKDPMEFLNNNKMLDEMMNRIYPADQRARDTLQGGDTTKPPPAPEGVDPKNWDKLVNSPPKGNNTDGQPISPADWAKAVLWLRDNPTPENKAKFDKKLAPSGYTADYVLKQLPPKPFVDTTGGPAVPDAHTAEPPPPSKSLLERIPQTLLPPDMRTNSEEEKNLRSADEELHLTPQEKFLYRMHLHNLNGPGGVDNPPDAQNPQGSRSTLYQAVQEHNGKFYNIPTVWNGKREVEPYTKPDGTVMDVPNKTALANVEKIGWDKFPSYATADEAEARYEKMHKFLDKDTAEYFGKKKKEHDAEKENERLVEEGRENIK